MIALSTGEIITLISAITAAIVSIIGAWRVGGVKSDVAGVKSDVASNTAAVADVKSDIATYNGATLGQLGAAGETRRVEDIAPADRTTEESRHLWQASDPSHPGTFQPPPPPKGS